MLRLPAFRYLRPRTLAEAARMVAEEGGGEGAGAGAGAAEGAGAVDGARDGGRGESRDGAGGRVRLVAGGTDLWPNMKRRHQKAATVVSLMGIPGMAGVSGGGAGSERPMAGDEAGAGELRIGATTLLEDVARHPLVAARYPALARAVASISSPPLRQMGTIGGNICLDTRCTYYNQTEEWRRSVDYCMKEEGSVCWVATSSPRCWAHAASDSAPMLCALGARVRLVSAAGERVLPLPALYRDDGIDYLAKGPGEIVAEILLPAEAAHGEDGAAGGRAWTSGSRCRASFWKLRRRGSIDFAVLSAAVALWLDGAGRVERARIFLGAVGSQPVEAGEAAAVLAGQPLTAETAAEAARLARKAATPMDNTDFQTQWRGVMVARYTEAALREAGGLEPLRLEPKHGMRAAALP